MAEKKITIKIPLEKGNTSDVFVSINERTWQIKRGVEVEVPECVAEELKRSQDAINAAYLYETEHTSIE
ncbi:MAG: hypothetical protein ACTTIO_04345 [Candidatus Fimenecus sp.]